MKKSIITLLLCLLMAVVCLHAQEPKISRTYKQTPLSEVLRDISRSSKDKKVVFIYDQLEDYTITCSFLNLSPAEAIYRAVGLYPIRVAHTERGIVVEPLRHATNKLIGRLVNENGEPVEFASVRLYNPVDSTFITGGASNENGDFVVPTNSTNVRMDISCLGYIPQSHSVTVGKVGTFVIYTNPTLLETVVVKADDIRFNNDHIEARPSKTQIEHSYNLFSLLNMQPFPGLEVDEVKGTINAFNGKVVLLVNGIERSTNYLLTIQPKNVAKINYYTTVPAKYADEGVGAVMEIILKVPNEGGSFYTQPMTAFTTGFVNAPVGATYNQGKSEFALQYNGHYRKYNDPYRSKTESYIGDDFRVDIKSDKNREPFNYQQHNFNADYTLRPDKSSAFVVSADVTAFEQTRYTKGEVSDTYQGDYYRYSKTHSKYLSPSLSAFFQKNWEGGKQFEAVVAASYSPQDYSRIMTDSLYATNEVLDYPSQVETKHKVFMASLFYQQPLNKNNHLLFRVSNSFTNTRSDYLLNNFTATNKHNTMYAFGSWSSKMGKSRLSARAGLNLKTIENNSRSWTKPFLNAKVSFGIPFGKGFDFSMSGELSPIIPSPSSLIENEQEFDGYLNSTGNPDLKTGYYLEMQQRLWWSHKKFWINLFVDEKRGYSPIYQDVTYRGNGKFIRRYENAQDTWRIAPTVTMGVKEVFGGHFTARLALSYNYFYAKLCDGHVNEHTSLYAMLNLYGYFGKWTVSYAFRKPTYVMNVNIMQYDENMSQLSVAYKVNKNLHLYAQCTCLFTKDGTAYDGKGLSLVNPRDYIFRIPDNKNMIVVGFRYDVNFGRLFGKVKRSTGASTPGADVQLVQ